MGEIPLPTEGRLCPQELEATVLFADLQDSTALAERLSPTRFSELLQGFYALATDIITARGGTIDKFLGDGLVALFLPGTSGVDHARRALEAAHALIAALDPADDGNPWPPVRIGVHSGRVWLGPVPGRNPLSEPGVSARGPIVQDRTPVSFDRGSCGVAEDVDGEQIGRRHAARKRDRHHAASLDGWSVIGVPAAHTPMNGTLL